jgi:hypothetical protein
MISKIDLIVEDELKHPDKYQPIARGPWVALCLMATLGILVPFWAGYLALRTGLSVIRKSTKTAL